MNDPAGHRSKRFVADALFIIERRFTRYSRGGRTWATRVKKRGFIFFLLDKPKRFRTGGVVTIFELHTWLLQLNVCLRPRYSNYKKKKKPREEGGPPTLYHRGAGRIDFAYKTRSFQKLIIDLVARYFVFSTLFWRSVDKVFSSYLITILRMRSRTRL